MSRNLMLLYRIQNRPDNFVTPTFFSAQKVICNAVVFSLFLIVHVRAENAVCGTLEIDFTSMSPVTRVATDI